MPTAPEAPGGTGQLESPPPPGEGERALLGIRGFAVTVYAKPSTGARKLGYLRVGALVARHGEPIKNRDCREGWYEIEPEGYVCTGADATTDLDDPLLRAATLRPNLSTALPYRYGFVRAVLPLYLVVPTAAQQRKFEMKLDEHLAWFAEHKDEVQKASLGSHDVAIDERGRAIGGKGLGEMGTARNSTELSLGELFGGEGDDDPPPFWLRDGRRLIPNISGFAVPEFAAFADRARRHTGLAFVGSFATGEASLERRFGITTDLRLAPTSKVKPDSGSPFHGVELGGEWKLPLAFVRKSGAKLYDLGKDSAEPAGDAERHAPYALTGKVRTVAGEKYFELGAGHWLARPDASLAVAPAKWPRAAKQGAKWIEVGLADQVMVLWEGDKPVFATLVSTGRPAIGDPKTTTATPRGTFRIRNKHVSATMDSDEGRARKDNTDKALKPGDPGYVPTKGDGLYGVSLRRGHGLFQLRDVPYIQYFADGYAIHGAYWHDVFGIARSHGCINLSPVDAHRVFMWTEPSVPEGWHGVNVEDGTTVIIHQ
ncbi:MAG: L,D-transpeptidase [Polyangiaceae bacterium]|nr:L,D-transpeptidase [Polyangiaceae bacterium]